MRHTRHPLFLNARWTGRRRCRPRTSCSIAFGFCASDAVLAEAEQVLQRITEQYFSPNLPVDEIRELVRSGKAAADPLKSFGEACRIELKSIRAAA